MNHDLSNEDGRIAAAKAAGRNIAAYEIRSSYTEPRDWNKDETQNARAFSHLTAVGFTRAGTRMYSQTFVDAYRAEFIRLRLEYLRTQIEAEQISTAELIELQGLTEYIEPGDVQLLEAAGVPEFPESSEYYWTGWEDEQAYEPGRPDTHFLTIHTPDGEEYAVIVHRTVDGKFPLDGDVAKGKERHAQHIVDALNAFNK